MRSGSALPSSVLLSPIETYYWALEKDSGTFRIAALCRIDGCIEADILAPALARLQQRHPKLRAVIAPGADGRMRYWLPAAATPIPFEIVECDRAETPWREETRRLLYRKLSESGLVAAVTVLRDRTRRRSDLLLAATHAIADGTAALMLVDDLLTEYAVAEAGGGRVPRPALPLLSPCRARSAAGWGNQLRLVRRFLGLLYHQRRMTETYLPESLGVVPLSQWVHWTLTQENTVRLVQRCRREGTSLNAALMASVFCGIEDCMKRSDGRFTWLVPLDLRSELGGDSGRVTADDLGCFACNMSGRIRVSQPVSVWEVARRVHQEIRSFQQRGGPSFAYNASSYIYGVQIAFARRRGELPPRHSISPEERRTVLATNYGVTRIRENYGSLRPIACTLNVRNDRHGPPLALEILVLGRQLNIGFAADRLDPALWDRLCAAVFNWIAAAAQS